MNVYLDDVRFNPRGWYTDEVNHDKIDYDDGDTTHREPDRSAVQLHANYEREWGIVMDINAPTGDGGGSHAPRTYTRSSLYIRARPGCGPFVALIGSGTGRGRGTTIPEVAYYQSIYTTVVYYYSRTGRGRGTTIRCTGTIYYRNYNTTHSTIHRGTPGARQWVCML